MTNACVIVEKIRKYALWMAIKNSITHVVKNNGIVLTFHALLAQLKNNKTQKKLKQIRKV